MSAKFLESVGSKLAEQWVATLLTPAFVFWAGGAAAGLQRFGWKPASTWFSKQPEPLQIALLVGGFCLIAASAFVVQRFDLPVLRFLEGYWHPWLRPLRRWLIAKEVKRSQRISARWQELADLHPAQLTAEQRDEFVQLDWQQIHLPLPNQLMPTRLGNILRAAEQRPLEKYGLDAIVCWSRLWLLLPDTVKKDLQEARADLNTAARVWLWSLLFIVWAIWAWWAAPVGIISAIFAYYYWALDAARSYGELIEATFDLHRHLLYQSLRWNLPTEPNEERRVGRQLTEYLWRGF
jgi:NADH:ubiquinone oxidoreductase subunit